MTALLTQTIFLYPWILASLLVLPLLWYLLRITPPAPRLVNFPATRFLSDLECEEQTPSKTPWWILLLRLLIAALIIIALARPVYNPAEHISGSGALRIVIDNSWGGAQNWDMQKKAAEEALKQASRENREMYLLTTAPMPGSKKPLYKGPMAYQEAVSLLRGLRPMPWPANYKAAKDAVLENKPKKSGITSIWLACGLDEGGIKPLIRALQSQGGLTYIKPQAHNLPLLLRPAKKSKHKIPKKQPSQIRIAVDAPHDIPDLLPVSVQAVSKDNDIIDIQPIAISKNSLPENVSFDIAPAQQNDTAMFRINGRSGAGSVFLMDNRFKKHNIGIAAPKEKTESAPLISAGYYIKRALEPYAVIDIDTIDELLKKDGLSTIILPDSGAMAPGTLNKLEEWVNDGGLLLRFSGPKLSQMQGGNQYLLPVRLKAGDRSLTGSLSWEEAQPIAPFDENSPFFGLDISPDIKIKRQVLADPVQDLEGKIWARLADGTPLVTGAPMGKGLLVLIHTTATPEWSDLALSGLYVHMLKRIIDMAGIPVQNLNINRKYLNPLLVMDSTGNLVAPAGYVQPLAAKNYNKFIPDSFHPPGIYGSGNMQIALNIGTSLPKLKAVGTLPSGVISKYYDTRYELDMMPYILYLAIFLYLIDWLIMIAIMSGLSSLPFKTGINMPHINRGHGGDGNGNGNNNNRSNGKANTTGKSSPAALLFVLLSAFTLTLALTLPPYRLLQAAENNPNSSNGSSAQIEKDIKYSTDLYLAYVITGDNKLDSTTKQGLEILADVLTRRTSVEPNGVTGVNPKYDTLAFFPLIYWALSGNEKPLSGKALQNIQNYLDHGGTIIFDTRNGSIDESGFSKSTGAGNLQKITKSLNIPPLTPIPEDHVLGKSFYLLDKFPGLYDEGTIWVEQESINGRDGVSSVIIGSNDWAGAWSQYTQKYYYSRENQSEMAIRTGVNMVMYALTGNYKNDQVHLPYILKRLDK